MLQKKYGALPTYIIAVQNKPGRAERLNLFNHYLNHRGIDIPNGKKNSSSNLVINSIVHKFAQSYLRDKQEDFFDNLLSEAKIIVWKATEKYLHGIKKIKKDADGKKNLIQVNYKEKWNFCKFASEQIKYGLKTHLYRLNIDQKHGKLPDSDTTRKLYYILPKFKFDNPLLNKENRYKEVSKKYNIDIKKVRLVDEFITQKTVSLDAPISADNEKELWQVIPDENSDNLESENHNNEVYNKLKKLTQVFLNNLPEREKEILERAKIKEDSSFVKLSKKFKISPERVRQIAENNFEKLKLFIKKHKKDLERM